MPAAIEAHLDTQASPEEVAAVQAALTEFGIDAKVEADYGQKAIGAPWVLVLLVGEIAVLFHKFAVAFVDELARQAARDAYPHLRDFVKAIAKARRSNNGSVVISTPDHRVQFLLTPQLPDEAFEAVFLLDFDSLERGNFIWDEQSGEWRDAMAR